MEFVLNFPEKILKFSSIGAQKYKWNGIPLNIYMTSTFDLAHTLRNLYIRRKAFFSPEAYSPQLNFYKTATNSCKTYP